MKKYLRKVFAVLVAVSMLSVASASALGAAVKAKSVTTEPGASYYVEDLPPIVVYALSCSSARGGGGLCYSLFSDSLGLGLRLL